MKDSTAQMPVLFVGHGSPMNAIEKNEFVDSWIKLGETLPKPKAIIAISAHWETRGTHITTMRMPQTIHDFSGFPQKLFDVQYPAAGNPKLASETMEAIRSTVVLPDENWGLDHGIWSVMKHIYPNADVPIIQLSLDYHKTPREHYELAKELQAFRKKGVLIFGSGNIVHNLRQLAWNKINEPEFGYDWAYEFNDTTKKLIRENDHKSLINYNLLGKNASRSIPTPEHFLPLLYALALQREEDETTFFNDKAVMGSLTMTSLKIG